MKITVDVYVNEWADGPDTAVIEITPELKERILRLRDVILDNDIFMGKVMDHSVEVFATDFGPNGEEILIKDDSCRIDSPCLVVMESGFHWDAYIKHTTSLIETESIPFDKLSEI